MYVRASGKPVFDANGEFRGYRGTGTDVTALIRAQEEHERLRRLESDLAHMNRLTIMWYFFFSSRRRHTRSLCDWSSDVCSSDLPGSTWRCCSTSCSTATCHPSRLRAEP